MNGTAHADRVAGVQGKNAARKNTHGLRQLIHIAQEFAIRDERDFNSCYSVWRYRLDDFVCFGRRDFYMSRFRVVVTDQWYSRNHSGNGFLVGVPLVVIMGLIMG